MITDSLKVDVTFIFKYKEDLIQTERFLNTLNVECDKIK